MHRTIGWYLIAALTLLPILLWAIGGGSNLTSAASIFRGLGQITGLLGIALFALSFVLALRQFRVLEELFGGLNHLYAAHHITGGLAFVAILVHPLLLAIRHLILQNPDRAASLLLPTRPASIYGWLAIVIMIVFLGLTFYARLRYHRWHAIHMLSGIAFIFSVVHVYIVPSDVTRDPVLGSYIGLLSLAGVVAFLSRFQHYLFGTKRYEYEVVKTTRFGPEVIEITLAPLGPRLMFEAGQFAYVSFGDPHTLKPNLESHPFSITSDPKDRELTFVIKALGDSTKEIQKLEKGDRAYLEGPFGRFSFRNAPHRKQIWVAGGIGITPFLSMARSLRRREKGYDIDLYYCTKEDRDAIFLEELRKIDRAYATFQLYPWCDDHDGLVSAKAIRKTSGSLKNADILIIGPQGMMKELRNQFEAEGVPASQITTEEFSFL